MNGLMHGVEDASVCCRSERLFAGEFGVVLLTELRGASNAKAKRDLGWEPRYPSWRRGFAAP
jgi:hypothetical protein